MKNFLTYCCLGLFVLSGASFSKEVAEDVNPIGCQDLGYHYHMNTLVLLPGESGPEQSMYFLFNQRNEPLNLYQMRNLESARSLYLNHTIEPKHWAVFAVHEKHIRFLCSIQNKKSKSPYGDVVDCSTSVKVCEFPHVRFGLNNKGNFWMVGNASRNEAVRRVVYYGIIP